MLNEKWKYYAKSWSLPDESRNETLRQLVTSEVTYVDPQSNVSGLEAFSAHIAEFQKNVPNAYFEILDVKEHHQKSLANWRLCGGDGNEIMKGTSIADVNEEGKFTSFTGFF